MVLLPERTKLRFPEIEPPKAPPPVEVRVARVREELPIVPPLPAVELTLVRAPKACEWPSRSTFAFKPLSWRSLTRAEVTDSPTLMVLSKPEARFRKPSLTVTTPLKPALAFKFIMPPPDFTNPTELPSPKAELRLRVAPVRTWNCGAWAEEPRRLTLMSAVIRAVTSTAEALASVRVTTEPSTP